jgi:hypothetical protein
MNHFRSIAHNFITLLIETRAFLERKVFAFNLRGLYESPLLSGSYARISHVIAANCYSINNVRVREFQSFFARFAFTVDSLGKLIYYKVGPDKKPKLTILWIARDIPRLSLSRTENRKYVNNADTSTFR